MRFDWLLRGSAQVTIVFFALVAVAVFTQLFKNTITRSLPFWLRALLKAGPALFLTWLSWYVGEPLTALMFLFCSLETSCSISRKTSFLADLRLGAYRSRWR
jgi:hypothetical protein